MYIGYVLNTRYSCPILMKLEFSQQVFSKNTEISSFMKIRPVATELFHANGRTDGRTDGWTDGRTDGWTDGRTDGRTDGWMDGWMDGWIWVAFSPEKSPTASAGFEPANSGTRGQHASDTPQWN
jgi:gamma-glutamylcysteine synthetase